MTEYGSSTAAEGYADMFRLWREGSNAPAVQLYAEVFGWSEAQRKVPQMGEVRARGAQLREELERTLEEARTRPWGLAEV